MKRREFLKGAGVAGVAAGAAAATGLATPAIAQGREKITLATTWGRGSFGVHDAAQRVADNVAAITGGTLEIDLKANGELLSGLQAPYDAVTSGQTDAFHSATYYYLGASPAFAFFTGVPFGMISDEMIAWMYHMGGQELFDELGEEFGLKSFLAGNTGTQAGGWFRKEINSAADFEGLKYRMPGVGGEVISKLGAASITMAGGEIYQALQSGAVDGAEWIGPASDESLGLQEAAPIYYQVGFHEPGVNLSFMMNLDRWDSLSANHQQALSVACADAHSWTPALYTAANGPALKRLIDGGTRVLDFPDEVWDAFGSATKEVMEEYRTDSFFARCHDSFLSSMASTSDWLSRSVGTFTTQRDRVMS